MVYFSGTRKAKSTAMQNQPTCGGSSKKCGLSSRIGFFMSSNPNMIRGSNTQWHNGLPPRCIPSTTIQTQQYGYRATISGNMG
jgi:hypothetical protein